MKRIVVIIEATEIARVREALRAAVGLGLRGDRVDVYARRLDTRDAAIARAVATLGELGRPVRAETAAIDGAAAVEVWT